MLRERSFLFTNASETVVMIMPWKNFSLECNPCQPLTFFRLFHCNMQCVGLHYFVFTFFFTFSYFTVNLHLMIKVKIIYMARKPKRNQEVYTMLGFLPKQKESNNTDIEQNNSVRHDTRVGSKTKKINEEREKLIVVG